jgi:hypothetical protein
MKRKLMWLTAIGAVVAVAYAQSVIVRGAYGLGFASGSNAERPDALFHFSVRQVEANGEIRNGGFFSIEAYSATGVVHVYIPQVRDIEVNKSERKAQFSGRCDCCGSLASECALATGRREGGSRG